jgi:hypothetical protein
MECRTLYQPDAFLLKTSAHHHPHGARDSTKVRTSTFTPREDEAHKARRAGQEIAAQGKEGKESPQGAGERRPQLADHK